MNMGEKKIFFGGGGGQVVKMMINSKEFNKIKWEYLTVYLWRFLLPV